MKVHHLNCGNMRVHRTEEATAVCHCLLVETGSGLVLVDSGIGTVDMAEPGRLGHMHHILRIARRKEDTALFQVRNLGFSAGDVQDIVLTHLDSDHTGGIRDFPHARVHVSRSEFDAAVRPSTFRERNRYSRAHLGPVKRWETYDMVSPEAWYGFDCFRGLRGLPEDILLVRLPGHTRGHCGVAVREDGRWLLLAGDAYYHHRQMDSQPGCPLYLTILQQVAHMQFDLASQTKNRLRDVVNTASDEVSVFCTHDPVEFSRMHDSGHMGKAAPE
ncbi:MAG TPA: MBL fold metallo-hydrolase [Deltaproteobacteria bacterium]|mgnify:CR=1 FL=1|jgi:glyoxylase-like metal-dependent hydrolase (beta-lactamase superfamily II)|nr:MBL fold metallo-hydrolase [Deltaproteobacteria bacterium]HOI07165.1 MBL fold metallo-hydrolase [Deltaproteobacteria bacterium]